jgi:hypothetical protein
MYFRGIKGAIIELLILATIAWVISLMIQIDPVGIHVNRWGLKWFVATYATAASVLVVIPFAVLFSVAASIAWLLKTKPYRRAYQFALVITMLWIVNGSYGHWYGKCRNEDGHSIEYCQSFGIGNSK